MDIKLPLKPHERELVIKRIVATDKPSRTGEKIVGSNKAYEVFSFPLSAVTYNSRNTRFKSEALTYKAANNMDLDAENPAHFKLIERYIWKQNPSKNNETIKTLIETGQQVPGIITRNGIVISGNRRLRLINEVHRNSVKYKKDIQSFEAVVLDLKDMTRERIIELETYYQFGEDVKQDYDPIQKYLAVHEQHTEDGVEIEKLARNYHTSATKIREYLEIYELMAEYLEYKDIVGHFDQLKNKEDPFIGLNSKIKKLKKGGGKDIDWPYDDGDIEQLKEFYFDNLFMDLFKNPAAYREVLKIFDTKSAWTIQLAKYTESTDSTSTPTIDEIKTSNPNLSDEEVIKKAASEYKNAHEESFRLGIGMAENDIRIKEMMDKPADLAQEARGALTSLKEAVQKLKNSKRTLEDKKRLSVTMMTIRNLTKDIDDLIK